ncbi:Mariner Mos1 transposase [Eumeta japonica]|uniref:Mariner Mos1 transposase n=1 Tax=Eumeta variegata TaxID=151549 RepID=A0A4C1XIV2_EUMVA|nr:Mariner Mos1 transposase [Eumeta japonica]
MSLHGNDICLLEVEDYNLYEEETSEHAFARPWRAFAPVGRQLLGGHFKPNRRSRRRHTIYVVVHYFIQKKSAAEAHRILAETYGDNALSDMTCRDWFQDFELEDKECSGILAHQKNLKMKELLDQDRCQTLTEFGKHYM